MHSLVRSRQRLYLSCCCSVVAEMGIRRTHYLQGLISQFTFSRSSSTSSIPFGQCLRTRQSVCVYSQLNDLLSLISTALLVDGPDIISPDGTILKSPFYEYLPTEWICILILVFYGLTTGTGYLYGPVIMFLPLIHVSIALHFGQAIYSRMWFLLPTVCLAGVGEIIGWGARVWSSISPLLQTPFLIQ